MNCLEKNQILEQHNLVRQLIANGKVRKYSTGISWSGSSSQMERSEVQYTDILVRQLIANGMVRKYNGVRG